ncbi:MAG: hypothetical protein ACRC2S_03760 [Waterburya sp.]
MINLLKLNTFNTIVLTIVILLNNLEVCIAEIATTKIQLTQANQLIKGQSGGSVDSQGCGFIATSPNYEMNLKERIDYMRLTVQATGGQPTLLVLGPGDGDSFCVLGDEVSGLKPEISGVWEAGNYQIYIGDRLGSQYQFTLNVSKDN